MILPRAAGSPALCMERRWIRQQPTSFRVISLHSRHSRCRKPRALVGFHAKCGRTVAVVYLLVRLEVLPLQVKSGPPRDRRFWLRPQAALWVGWFRPSLGG